MWPFKKKSIKTTENTIVETIEIEKPIEKELQKPERPDVLHNEDPWRVDSFDHDEDEKGYIIRVYLFGEAGWRDLDDVSEIVLGVKYEEFKRILVERFDTYKNNPWKFKSEVMAKKALEEFRRFYHDFYMPRAVMERLMFYQPGGYQPYFQWYADEHNIKVPEYNEE